MTDNAEHSRIEIEIPVPWSIEPAKVRVPVVAAVTIDVMAVAATFLYFYLRA
jgi:hypothetical protein